MSTLRIEYGKAAPGAVQGMYAANSYFDACSIAPLLRRQIELRVSQINGCSYCIWAHSRQLKELGETEGRLAAVERWQSASCFDDAEKAALHWAELVTRISEGVPSDGAFAERRRQFEDRQIVDLTAIAANMNALNRLAISFRREAPGG